MSSSLPPDSASPLELPAPGLSAAIDASLRPDPRLVEQLLAGGVRPGGVLLVHTSFRAVRGDQPMEGGPLGLIHALLAALGPDGTLVMPTMTDGETPFDPRATPTTDMGITAETFWRQPGVLRSTHPGGSFAAHGPHAARICAEQPLSPPHGPDSPVGRVHELDGQVLLLGVTHSENTTLHLAESLAAVPYATASDALLSDGTVVTVAEPNHCCNNFRLADGWLRPGGLQRDFVVGAGPARLFSARALVALAVPRLTAEPLLFLCPPAAACAECDLARASAAR
jgi:aminoglycoside 3-N-acetyltransferase